jgi:hypothetical protein
MKIKVNIRETGNITDVRTIVDIGGKIYSDGTGLTTMATVRGRARELEILENVKRHITIIQANILKEV